MAMQTVVLAGGGDVSLEYDYDDATMLLRAVRLINNTAQNVFVSVTSTVNGRSYSRTAGAGTAQVNVGTGQAQRLQLSVTPSGKLGGVFWQFVFPAP